MSRFFVGQKVRIVDATVSKFLIGREARVTALDVVAIAAYGGPTYIGTETDQINKNGLTFVARPGQLEPIIPDGAVKGDFSFHELMDNLKEQQDVLSLHA